MADTILKFNPKDDGAGAKRKRSLIGFARALCDDGLARLVITKHGKPVAKLADSERVEISEGAADGEVICLSGEVLEQG